MKEGLAVISLLLSLQSKALAQSPTFDAKSAAGESRIASVIAMDQALGSADREFRHAREAFSPRSPTQAQPGSRTRHPILLGTAIGAGAGLLINVTACRTGESVCSAPGNLLMAGIGAGIGALVGVLVSRH